MSAADPSRSNGSREGTSTSRSLLVRIQDRDSEAWSRLVDLYAPLVYHWCRAMDVSEQDMPDIVQDVFQSVTRKIGDFRRRGRGGTFRGWLRVITRNKVIDHYRRFGRQPASAGGTEAQIRLSQLPDTFAPVDDADDDRQTGPLLFARALELIRPHFTEQTWRAFWEVAVGGKTAAEAAGDLGMTPGAVRVAKSRVLQRLRAELGELFE